VAYLDLAAEVERRRQAGHAPAPVYRIYLRDEAGAVVSGHTIAIESDAGAIKVATILRDSRTDVTAEFEIWKGEELLAVGGEKPSRGEFSLAGAEITPDGRRRASAGHRRGQ
jgi:hypothetical protein